MVVSKNWVYQRKFLQLTYNKEVNEYFRDIDDEELDTLNQPRKIAKRACLILPSDTQNMALIKMNTFWYVVQRIQDKPAVMGMTKGEYDQQFKYRPEIHFYFRQDPEAVPDGYAAEEFVETLCDNEVDIDPYLDIIDRNLELFGI
ncbi:hypothetical protein [Gloeothece verrucosa]|uniref:Uncharacterized protein n=1 Tax=Gloeothece verrucosa (strain PCC 7822) TaxID=497965 RepID=E0UJ77_GLOV7|nr:hypothetical protein [Gloeothece verrucosa]ADN15780.1 hypothetical protein Cyan7822_3848 [Gloeothece verrucosa PCC 7822]